MLNPEKIEFIHINESGSNGSLFPIFRVYMVSRILEDFKCDTCKKSNARAYKSVSYNDYNDNSARIDMFICDICISQELQAKPLNTVTRIPINEYKAFKFQSEMELK